MERELHHQPRVRHVLLRKTRTTHPRRQESGQILPAHGKDRVPGQGSRLDQVREAGRQQRPISNPQPERLAVSVRHAHIS